MVSYRFECGDVLGSGVWVGFIVPLGMFLRSDASMAFVMRWLAVWESSWRGVFLSVCSMSLVYPWFSYSW